MSDEGQSLTPEHIFKKFMWRHIIAIGNEMEKFTTWTITGIAAVVALLIGNIDSVGNIITSGGIQLALTLFVGSLLAGVLSKQFGMAVSTGLALINELENLLNSEAGQNLLDKLTVDSTKITDELAAPFWWPLSVLMRRGGRAGAKDYLFADKRLVRLFCVQLFLNTLHVLLGAAALVSLAVFLD